MRAPLRSVLCTSAALLAAATLVAGCSGGLPGASGSQHPTSASTDGAGATSQPSDTPTATTTTDPALTAALPGIDALPTGAGWKVDTAETLDKITLPATDTNPDECGLVTSIPVWSRIGGTPTGQAYVGFSDAASPANAAAVQISAYTAPLDTTIITALDQLPDSCSSFSTTMNGADATGSVASLDVPKLGDDSASATIYVTGNGRVFVTQIQVIAVGDDLVTALQSTILDPTTNPDMPSPDAVAALAKAAVESLGAAG